MTNSGKDAILCAIDFVGSNDEIVKKVLGVNKNTKVIDSVNYQKLSLNALGAVAQIEFDTKSYSLDEVKAFLLESNTDILASMRCNELNVKKDNFFFETMASCAINNAIQINKDLIYIDCFNNKYKILKLKSLK